MTSAAMTITADQLPRFMACNPSRVMAASFPPTPGNDTIRDEGIAAHWFAQQWFDGTLSADYDGKAPNGIYITPIMSAHVGEYLAALESGELECSTSYAAIAWYVGGRADHISWRPDYGTLTVDDFKYGWRIVEPDDNWTLIYHAAAYCILHQIAPREIILRIHQPRPLHPDGKLREWRISYARLIELYNQLDATLTNPSETLQAGPHCTRCHSAATCPANQRAGFNAVAASDLAFDNDVSDADLAYELDVLATAADVLSNRLDALRELGKHRLTGGAVIANYALERQFANTRFKPEFNNPAMLRVLTGADMSKPGTVTPAEAKRRGMSDDIYNAITERPQTGVKLVRVDADKRARRALGNRSA